MLFSTFDCRLELRELERRKVMSTETPTYQCIALAPGDGVAPPSINLRNDMQEWTSAERAIHDATLFVEAAGANPLLTDAVNLLAHARQKLAMWIETGAAGAYMAPAQSESGDKLAVESAPVNEPTAGVQYDGAGHFVREAPAPGFKQPEGFASRRHVNMLIDGSAYRTPTPTTARNLIGLRGKDAHYELQRWPKDGLEVFKPDDVIEVGEGDYFVAAPIGHFYRER